MNKGFSFLEVESLVDKRLNDKQQVEFLIHWRGYDSSYDSWEPLEHLNLIKDLIDIYELSRLKEDPNYIIEDEVKAFISKDSSYSIIDPRSNEYLPKSTDIPLKILSVTKYQEDIYALIEWQVRTDSGLKPKNSYIHSNQLKKNKQLILLYLNYLEALVLIDNSN